MQLDDSPLYRKTIIPWYDSETACLLVVVIMFPVVIFALCGIKVADEHAQYRAFVWLPVLLAIIGVLGNRLDHVPADQKVPASVQSKRHLNEQFER